MHFLKTLFWIVVAVLVFYLSSHNWHDVTLNLWGDIQVDIKLPILLALMLLMGWLPTYILHRAKLWHARSRLGSYERQQAEDRLPEAAVAGPDA